MHNKRLIYSQLYAVMLLRWGSEVSFTAEFKKCRFELKKAVFSAGEDMVRLTRGAGFTLISKPRARHQHTSSSIKYSLTECYV